MNARPRAKKYKDLPANLYARKQGLKYFYYYKEESGIELAFGSKKKVAIIAAQKLNQERIPDADKVIAKARGATGTLKQFTDKYFNQLAKEREYSSKTKQEYSYRISIACDYFKQELNKVTTKDCADFLDQWNDKPRQKQSYRTLLSMLFNYSKSKGWTNDNPVTATTAPIIKVIRNRLTMDGFNDIYSHANESIKTAMDIALITLQRREDVSKMNLSHYQQGILKVRQSKTGSLIEIEPGENLKQVLSHSRESALRVGARTFVHQPISANRARRGQTLSPSSITRGFKTARDKSSFYDDLKPLQRPSFHEIRALGAEVYRLSGIDEKEIQAMLGHSDIEMTRVYLSRHEKQWAKVKTK